MTFIIQISDRGQTTDDMADLLRHIAGLLDQGNTSGVYPIWELVTQNDDPDTGVDPEEHAYRGDGTCGCKIAGCAYPMNAHITFEESS